MTYRRVAFLACLLVVLAAAGATASVGDPTPGGQSEPETVTRINAAELERGLFLDESGSQVDVPQEVEDREYGFGAAIQSTRRPDAALVGVSANKLVVYDGRNESFTVVDRPSKADLQNVPSGAKRFVDADRAQVSSEVIRGQVVVGTGFGPLVYDLSKGTWAGEDPFAISLKKPWLFDTDPRPPIHTESYVVQPNLNGGIFVTVPEGPNNRDEQYPDHAITRDGRRMALVSDVEPGQDAPGFPVIFEEGIGNATADRYMTTNVVAEPGTDTVFITWGATRLLAYNLSTASQEWGLDRDDLTAHSEYPNLFVVDNVRYHDGSLYVLARFTSEPGGGGGGETRLLALSPEDGSVGEAYNGSRWTEEIVAVDDDRIVAVDQENIVAADVVEVPIWNRTSGEQLQVLQYERPIANVMLVDDALLVRFEDSRVVEVVHLPSGENATTLVKSVGQLYETPDGITVASFRHGNVRETNLTRSIALQATTNRSAVTLKVSRVDGTPTRNATVTVGGISKPVADDGTVRFSVDELALGNATTDRVERTVRIETGEQEHATTLAVAVEEEINDSASTPKRQESSGAAGGFGPVAALAAALLAAALLWTRRE